MHGKGETLFIDAQVILLLVVISSSENLICTIEPQKTGKGSKAPSDKIGV